MYKRQVPVVSDEIHSDLIFHGKKHIPTASLSPEIAANVITGISGTKTFNLAGLQASTVVFPNQHKKQVFDHFWQCMDIHRNNAFSLTAMEAAFNQGEEWLEPVSYTHLDGVVTGVEEVLHHVPQLPDVAGPGVVLQKVPHLGRQAEAGPQLLLELLQQQEQVVPPGGQGRDLDGQGAEPVLQDVYKRQAPPPSRRCPGDCGGSRE